MSPSLFLFQSAYGCETRVRWLLLCAIGQTVGGAIEITVVFIYSYNLQQYNQIKSNTMIKTIQLRGNQAIKWHLWQPIYIIQHN